MSRRKIWGVGWYVFVRYCDWLLGCKSVLMLRVKSGEPHSSYTFLPCHDANKRERQISGHLNWNTFVMAWTFRIKTYLSGQYLLDFVLPLTCLVLCSNWTEPMSMFNCGWLWLATTFNNVGSESGYDLSHDGSARLCDAFRCLSKLRLQGGLTLGDNGWVGMRNVSVLSPDWKSLLSLANMNAHWDCLETTLCALAEESPTVCTSPVQVNITFENLWPTQVFKHLDIKTSADTIWRQKIRILSAEFSQFDIWSLQPWHHPGAPPDFEDETNQTPRELMQPFMEETSLERICH